MSADLLALLHEARKWLNDVGAESEGRPDEVDELQTRIDAALAEHEAERQNLGILLRQLHDEPRPYEAALLSKRILDLVKGGHEAEPEPIGEIYDFNIATGNPLVRFRPMAQTILTVEGLPYPLYARPITRTEPERKCGTCEYHRGCDIQERHAFEIGEDVNSKQCRDWFCADWQRKGEA